MCSKCPPPARIHDLRRSRHWSIAASIMFYSESTQVCVKRFWRSDVTNLCFVHALLHNNPKFYNVQVHFDEAYTIHLMQFSMVISHCNITFSLFRISQGSVATLIKEWSSYSPMYRSPLNLTMKTALKSVLIFHEVTDKNKISWFIFVAHGVSCFFFHYYIRQGECFRRCLSVCLVVSNFAGKLPNGFAWNFQGRLATDQ